MQQTFASAHRSLEESDRPIDVKPWLYAIARNRCLSMLRARKPDALPIEDEVLPGAALAEQAEVRDELRDLVRDLADLPEQQRSALVLFELGDLSHAEIAEVIGCEERQVKGIVFRARTGLSERREGRMAPCGEIREELSTLRKGALRRSRIRHHLRECPSCAAFRDDVRRQRAQMAMLLPAAPSAALKAGVLGSGAAAVGSTAATKLAIVAVLAGSVGGAGVAVEEIREAEESPAPTAEVSRSAADGHSALGATVATVRRQVRRAASAQTPAAAAAKRRAQGRRTALPETPGRTRGMSKAADPGKGRPRPHPLAADPRSREAPGRSAGPRQAEAGDANHAGQAGAPR